jgi:hypothetical protein
MKELLTTFPIWFSMVVVAVLVGAIVYRLIKKGVKIKVGPVEIDAEDDTPAPVKEEPKPEIKS